MDPKPPNSKVHMVVIGDLSTGKSSLILSAIIDTFPEKVPSVLLPTSFPMDIFPTYNIPITITVTSSNPIDINDTFTTCQNADVIVLTYSCDRPSTLERLTTYWLPELRRHNINAPVIITGCKSDLSTVADENFEQVRSLLMEQFQQVKTCIQCSALSQMMVSQVFYYAQCCVHYPIAPLFDEDNQTLRPRFISALKRIFILCDQDRDGVLNDKELSDYEFEYFDSHLDLSEISLIKKTVQAKMVEGCNDNGLTLTGFLLLHAMMIETGGIDHIWQVLRKRGYDNNIMLQDNEEEDDDIHGLTNEVVKFLSEYFDKFVVDKDGSLHIDELGDLFSTEPENTIWFNKSEASISVDRFISAWALVSLLDPVKTFSYLTYLGYAKDYKTAFNKDPQCRSCIQCFVFGPKKAGKSALLNWLDGKTFSEEYTPTASEGFAASMVEVPGEGTKKILIMREVPEETVESLWSKKNSLAACDIAIFVHDSCDDDSWKRAMDMLVQFATRCENNGYRVPSFIASAKDDLINGSPVMRVCQNVKMEVEMPVLSVSAKLRNDSNFFWRIIYVAQHPHMFIPETEDSTKRKRRARLLKGSVAAATIALFGLASYKIYASRKKLLRRFMP